MAFRHYGGSTPAPATEWTCGSCGHEQAGPLKAGCQKCGSGADARKVGEIPASAALPLPAHVLARQVAYDEWRAAHPLAQDLLEAFMAGVAWAQGQTGEKLPPPLVAASPAPAPSIGGSVALFIGVMDIYHGDDAEDTILPEQVEGPTLQTILAALAFYRDNVLNYGAVPGQLSAEQVSELIARLSPVEEP